MASLSPWLTIPTKSGLKLGVGWIPEPYVARHPRGAAGEAHVTLYRRADAEQARIGNRAASFGRQVHRCGLAPLRSGVVKKLK